MSPARLEHCATYVVRSWHMGPDMSMRQRMLFISLLQEPGGPGRDNKGRWSLYRRLAWCTTSSDVEWSRTSPTSAFLVHLSGAPPTRTGPGYAVQPVTRGDVGVQAASSEMGRGDPVPTTGHSPTRVLRTVRPWTSTGRNSLNKRWPCESEEPHPRLLC
ncbi:uncharacterized protein [Dermacentor albipictus]|uniref:uncharacterized protein n=1 Tax=Dermacentor albipictus TaxID=60249 RepID=UPI0038FC6248